MERNIKEELKKCSNNFKKKDGITLIALVITLIVLLILAGVSLNAVFNKKGIFSRAEQATKLYGKEKSREELTVALADAEIKKYSTGLNSDQLDEELNKVGQVDQDENRKVTVDGHIWLIDRDTLEIVDYLGEDDGIEIRYTIEGNDNYIVGTPNIKVKVTVRNNKGELDINSIQITKNGSSLSGIAISNNGEFELNVTELGETIFTVSAKNSEGEQSVPRTIKVIPKIDTTKPVISNQSAVASGMKITISARAADNESGLRSFTYSVSPTTVKDGKASGSVTSGVPIEIETTAEGTYTVTFNAEDNAGNSAVPVTATATTTDTISVADLKNKINASNYADYLGAKVDYQSPKGGVWRVFYYDGASPTFGSANTVYLKRDYDSNLTINPWSKYSSTTPSETAVNYMKQLNPQWRDSSNGSAVDLANEKMSAGFYEQNNAEKWGSYRNTSYSSYAIGTAPIEMWCKAQQAYKSKYDTSANAIGCGIMNTNGYGYTINGGSLVNYQNTTVVNTNIPQSAVIATGSYQWLASPSSRDYNYECYVNSSTVLYSNHATIGACPVVPLDL